MKKQESPGFSRGGGSQNDYSDARLRLGAMGPDGRLRPVNPAELPEELRRHLTDAVSQDDSLPPQLRAAVLNNLDAAVSAASDEQAEAEAEPGSNGADRSEENEDSPHAQRTCDHESESYQRFVWSTLDTIHPHDPHLWQATENLLVLGSGGAVRPDEPHLRIAGMAAAIQHLEAAIAHEQEQLDTSRDLDEMLNTLLYGDEDDPDN